jgi:hypothetical protein
VPVAVVRIFHTRYVEQSRLGRPGSAVKSPPASAMSEQARSASWYSCVLAFGEHVSVAVKTCSETSGALQDRCRVPYQVPPPAYPPMIALTVKSGSDPRAQEPLNCSGTCRTLAQAGAQFATALPEVSPAAVAVPAGLQRGSSARTHGLVTNYAGGVTCKGSEWWRHWSCQ